MPHSRRSIQVALTPLVVAPQVTVRPRVFKQRTAGKADLPPVGMSGKGQIYAHFRGVVERIRAMTGGTVWLDASLEAPKTVAEVRMVDLRGRAGPRSAALYGLMVFARETGVVPPEALAQMVRQSDIGNKVSEAVLSV